MSVKVKHDPYAALYIKEFLFFLNTRLFLTLAIQMQSTIVGLQIYKHTGKLLSLGMTGLAEAIPYIIASLFAGHIADTYNRKNIILIFSSLLIICTSFLLYFSLETSTVIEIYGTMPIFIVIGAFGVIRGFLAAAFPSFMSQIVPR
nr:MFS transporter [Bacteroidota bacterium]